MIKKAISFVAALLLTLSFFAPAAFAKDYGMDVETTSKEVYLVCVDTGEVIYQKDADTQIHPASTVKIMSAALAMTMCGDLENTLVTAPDDLWNEFDGLNVSSVGIQGGEQLTMYDLLHCMLISSANEAASAVASYFGYDAFIAAMNAKALELGCTNTHFVDPHGVFDGNYTTAADMYRITAWAITVPGFLEICGKASYTVPATNKSDARELTPTNAMLVESSGYYTSYIKGVKTGTTSDSSGTWWRFLVTYAQKDGMNYILVCMGAPYDAYSTLIWEQGNTVYTDTRAVLDWAFKNIELKSPITTTSPVTELRLRYAWQKDSLILYPESEIFAAFNKNSTEEPLVEYEITELPEYVNAPVENGQVVGKARVKLDGEDIGEINLVARETVELSRFAFVIDNLSVILTSTAAKIIYAVLLVIVLLYLYYMLVLVPRARKKYAARKKRRGK
ncbi:MAG: serine hydrolase [Oscillospiraceae bacterium]|nr:serine hydrolase [Oscillospiraceae bacterium]